MRLCLVSAILTIFVSIQFQSAQFWLLGLLVIAVIFTPLSNTLSNAVVVRFFSVVSIILTVLYCQSWLDNRLESRLPGSSSKKIIEGYGEVVGCRDISLDVQKLNIRFESVVHYRELNKEQVTGRQEQLVVGLKEIAINYYRRNQKQSQRRRAESNNEAFLETPLLAKVPCGSIIKFKAKLRPPYSFINPWGFDYEAFLLSKGIDASGYLVSHEVVGWGSSWRSQLLMLRESWVQRARALPGPAGQLVPALLFGESGYLPKDKWLDFQLTGTIHLLIVSGLHVGFLVFLVTIVWFLLIRVEVLILFPRSSSLLKWTPIILLSVCMAYAYMAGMGLAVQRAGLMLGVGICVVYYRHHWSLFDTWLWVILLVLIVNPLSILFIGFWFSFAAVGALLMSYSGQIGLSGNHPSTTAIKLNEKIKLLVHPQWVVFLALMPLLWSFQQSQSLLSFLVNILAIPLLGFVIMPLAMSGVVWPESLAVELLNTVLSITMDFLHQVSLLPSWLIYKPSGIWLLCLFPLVLLSLCLPGIPFKRLCGLLLVVVFLLPVVGNKDKLIVFDVGQGLAVYGSVDKVSWLYDTGAEFRSGFSLGDAVVAKNILALNGKKLDLLFVSHSDNDHAGGERGLRRKIVPLTSYAGQPRQAHHSDCHLQEGWHRMGEGDNRWRVFQYSLGNANDNNQSCVVQIEMSGKKIMLPGDIDNRAEALLMSLYGDELKSDVLIVGHHGSKSSSSRKWLMQVDPKLAIVSSGFNNRFKHPHSTIVNRFNQLSIPLYNTADSGAIEIELAETLLITQWRKKNSPIWRQM